MFKRFQEYNDHQKSIQEDEKILENRREQLQMLEELEKQQTTLKR